MVIPFGASDPPQLMLDRGQLILVLQGIQVLILLHPKEEPFIEHPPLLNTGNIFLLRNNLTNQIRMSTHLKLYLKMSHHIIQSIICLQ